MNIRGFLRWQFEGTLSNPSFYGFALTILGFLAALGGCPAPWPAATSITGLVVVFVDAARSWFRFSYSIYEMEQNRIARELTRKDR